MPSEVEKLEKKLPKKPPVRRGIKERPVRTALG